MHNEKVKVLIERHGICSSSSSRQWFLLESRCILMMHQASINLNPPMPWLCRSCHSKFAFCPSKLVISPKLPARQCSITRHCCAMPIHPHPPPFCREQRPFYFFVPLHPCFCPVTLVLGLSCSRARPLLLIFLYFPLFIIKFFFSLQPPPLCPPFPSGQPTSAHASFACPCQGGNPSMSIN